MFRSSFKLALVLTAGLSVVACTKSGETSRKFTCKDGVLQGTGIVGGEVLNDNSWLAQGLVLIATRTSEDGGELCTGSLVDNNIVLTAAHCVNNRRTADDVMVLFSADPICNIVTKKRTDLRREADKVVHHENFISTNYGYDIAMIRMKEKAPENTHVMPILLSSTRLPRDIVVSGYGNEVDYGVSESPVRLKQANVSLYLKRNGDNSEISETSTNQNRTISLDQRLGQGACAGDSGGPAMIRDGSYYTVIGVASRVVGLNNPFRKQEDVTCKQGAEYTSLSYYQEWIGNTYNALKNENSRGRLLVR